MHPGILPSPFGALLLRNQFEIIPIFSVSQAFVKENWQAKLGRVTIPRAVSNSTQLTSKLESNLSSDIAIENCDSQGYSLFSLQVMLGNGSYRCHCRSAVSVSNMSFRVVFPNSKSAIDSFGSPLAVVRTKVLHCTLGLDSVAGFVSLSIPLFCKA